jgi:hypothetical protein
MLPYPPCSPEMAIADFYSFGVVNPKLDVIDVIDDEGAKK